MLIVTKVAWLHSASLNSGALAVARQPKNSGAATGFYGWDRWTDFNEQYLKTRVSSGSAYHWGSDHWFHNVRGQNHPTLPNLARIRISQPNPRKNRITAVYQLPIRVKWDRQIDHRGIVEKYEHIPCLYKNGEIFRVNRPMLDEFKYTI